MERLTSHSKYSGTPTPNLKTIGDVCMKMPFCDDYDACEGCEIRRIIDRLCEYEDTGLTPEEISILHSKITTSAKRKVTHYMRYRIFTIEDDVTLVECRNLSEVGRWLETNCTISPSVTDNTVTVETVLRSNGERVCIERK